LTDVADPSVIIIAGPTASGKSALALELAAALGGTIINADSQQIYRDLKILSARPDAAAMRQVPHRLYGFLDAAERGSVGRWRALALAEIAAAQTRGSLPFLVGGTGLYLRALQHGLAAVPPIPAAIRAEAAALFDALGGPAFRDRLMPFDATAASRLPSGDRQRLMRAWEVVRATGRPLDDWQRGVAGLAPYRFATVLMMPSREALYAACDARFAAMIAGGAIEEAAAVRLRPILMTTAAMVVGMAPLIFATGAGAVSRFNIGVTIFFGMAIGTLFTLFVLPAVYTVLAKDHHAAAHSMRARELAEVS